MDMIEIEQPVRPHRLSVVVPMYNEEDSVTPLVTQVHEALAAYRHPWELVLVNDGSSDSTAQQMRLATELWGRHVRVIDLPCMHVFASNAGPGATNCGLARNGSSRFSK